MYSAVALIFYYVVFTGKCTIDHMDTDIHMYTLRKHKKRKKILRKEEYIYIIYMEKKYMDIYINLRAWHLSEIYRVSL